MKVLTPEDIFAHAVALHQAGRLRSRIFCKGKAVYVLNLDSTVLLSFAVTGKGFPDAVAFLANDYDSKDFREVDGKIVFSQQGANFDRKKYCNLPGEDFAWAEALFAKYGDCVEGEPAAELVLEAADLGLLEDGLSHVEFARGARGIKLVQRDIYSGTIIELERADDGGLELKASDKVDRDFERVALRTSDLFALFTFADVATIKFYGQGWAWVESPGLFKGVLSCCVYDEMGGAGTTNMEINKEKMEGGPNHGRQIPEGRRREQNACRKAEGGAGTGTRPEAKPEEAGRTRAFSRRAQR